MHRFFFCWKAETISQNFPKDSMQIMMLAMTSCLDKKIRIVTKSRCGHPLNNQSSNQQFQILAYKRRYLPCIQASWFSDQDHALYFFLYIFVMFKFYFMLYFPYSLVYVFHFLYYTYVLMLFIYVYLLHYVQLSLLCQCEKVSLMVLEYV